MATINYTVNTSSLPVTVKLVKTDGTVVATNVHNTVGSYSFTSVTGGSYTVQATDAQGCAVTSNMQTVAGASLPQLYLQGYVESEGDEDIAVGWEVKLMNPHTASLSVTVTLRNTNNSTYTKTGTIPAGQTAVGIESGKVHYKNADYGYMLDNIISPSSSYTVIQNPNAPADRFSHEADGGVTLYVMIAPSGGFVEEPA